MLQPASASSPSHFLYRTSVHRLSFEERGVRVLISSCLSPAKLCRLFRHAHLALEAWSGSKNCFLARHLHLGHERPTSSLRAGIHEGVAGPVDWDVDPSSVEPSQRASEGAERWSRANNVSLSSEFSSCHSLVPILSRDSLDGVAGWIVHVYVGHS